jgi:hypothetical protein
MPRQGAYSVRDVFFYRLAPTPDEIRSCNVRLIHRKGQPISPPLPHPQPPHPLPSQQDKIPIHPSQFGLPPEQALIHELNKKYANRVLHDVGLCICVFDVAEVGEGKIRYGDGFLWYTGEPLLSNTG